MENDDLIYWRHPTVPGIKVEEISGGEGRQEKLQQEMARQLYCENGRDEYREIGYFKNGAPFLYGESTRISITHCKGLLAVATLAPTPDIDLSEFNPVTALGIDAERKDRSQVVKLRERFLNEKELALIPADNIELNVQAWTVKEAVYKAIFQEGIDFRKRINIERLGDFGPAVPVFDPREFGLKPGEKELPERFFGEVTIEMDSAQHSNESAESPEKSAIEIKLKTYSYFSDDCIVTLAYSAESAVYGKSVNS